MCIEVFFRLTCGHMEHLMYARCKSPCQAFYDPHSGFEFEKEYQDADPEFPDYCRDCEAAGLVPMEIDETEDQEEDEEEEEDYDWEATEVAEVTDDMEWEKDGEDYPEEDEEN